MPAVFSSKARRCFRIPDIVAQNATPAGNPPGVSFTAVPPVSTANPPSITVKDTCAERPHHDRPDEKRQAESDLSVSEYYGGRGASVSNLSGNATFSSPASAGGSIIFNGTVLAENLNVSAGGEIDVNGDTEYPVAGAGFGPYTSWRASKRPPSRPWNRRRSRPIPRLPLSALRSMRTTSISMVSFKAARRIIP